MENPPWPNLPSPIFHARRQFSGRTRPFNVAQIGPFNPTLTAAMEGRLDNGCVLCQDGGSALIGYALKSGHEFKVTAPGRYVFTPDPHYHIQTVNACHSEFRTWMMRFQGVATKYLKNYVGWKRCLQTMLRDATPMAWLRNCIAPGQPML